MSRSTIAIDMDEVVADVIPKFTDLYEQHFGVRPTPESYHGRKLYEHEDAQFLRDALHEPGFFRDLPVMDNAVEVVRELYQHYDIYFVSAAMEFPHSFRDKYDWLDEHFAFIPWKNWVFCGKKNIIGTDYLIDDHVRNLQTFRGTGLLYTASHNVHNRDYQRVDDWLAIRQYFRENGPF